MSNKPRGHGLSADIAKKMNAKYDDNMEQEARLWIEQILGMELVPGSNPGEPVGAAAFGTALKDGQVLSKLVNALMPGKISKINAQAMAFKQMENIGNYLKACEDYGVSKGDLFQTVDLYEQTNMVAVVNGIHALGRAAQKNGYSGPVLGVKESDANVREFTDEQMKAGQHVIGLQMGSNEGASQAGMTFGKRRFVVD